MPILTVSMYSGRTQREKDRLAEAITEDITKILTIKKEEVIIVFQRSSLMGIGIPQELVYNITTLGLIFNSRCICNIGLTTIIAGVLVFDSLFVK